MVLASPPIRRASGGTLAWKFSGVAERRYDDGECVYNGMMTEVYDGTEESRTEFTYFPCERLFCIEWADVLTDGL